MQTGVAVSVPPIKAPPEIEAELHTGAAAEAGFAIVMKVTKTPATTNKARIFAEISLMGGKTTPKGEVSSRHVGGTAYFRAELRKCETSISRYSLAEILLSSSRS